MSEGNSIFRKASVDKVSSPEQLNDYIRVTNPSVWIILFAVAALLIGALIWSIFGTLPTTVNSSAAVKHGVMQLFVSPEEAADLSAGMTVSTGGAYGTIARVGDMPLSHDEAAEGLSDYEAYALGLDAWNVPVEVDIQGVADGIVSVTITTASVRPISFLLN